MPPRHAFWTIIYGNAPTSFRAATQEELLPTLKQLQATHPDAVMKWFARGRLWTSPDEAREALYRQRATRPDRRGSSGATRDRRSPWQPPAQKPRTGEGRSEGERRDGRRHRGEGSGSKEGTRGRQWRPGGAHRDPRDRFKVPRDVRRKRFAARVRRNAAPPGPPHKKKKDEK